MITLHYPNVCRLKNVILSVGLIIFPIFFSQAQSFSIRGKVIDSKNKPVLGANVRILSTDSVYLAGDVTDTEGNFTSSDHSPGNYLIKISFVGYNDKFMNVRVVDKPLVLDKIILEEKTETIKEVTVTGQVITAQQKGDTTQYNAGAFKTNPDATAEDLINKMPGITVEDGKLKAQGEDVKRVLVDGKPFFGDDPSAVLKNLPAEVIDKIQIFDSKSEQSQLTGFDDGNTTKTINIITKSQFKNGIFGKTYVGYGYEDKWRAGFSVNYFKNNRRITFLGNTNNINEQNFSSEDLVGVISSPSGGSGRAGGSSGGQRSGGNNGGRGSGGRQDESSNFLVDQRNGITTTNAFGINYADKFKKVDFSGSYFLNQTENNSISQLNRTFISNESKGITYAERRTSLSKNTNHRVNLKFDWKINETNTLIFQPKLTYQSNKSESEVLGENNLLGKTLSRVINDYNASLEGINFSAPVQYRHSFKRKGRAITAYINPTYTNTNGWSHLNYSTVNSDTLASDTIIQNSDLKRDGYMISSTASYSEPISKKSQLLLTYTNTYSKNLSDKNTYESETNRLDTSLSNSLNTIYTTNSIGGSYRYNFEKLHFNTGISYQVAQLNNEQFFPSARSLNKTFYSLLPNAMMQYKFSKNDNLRINYNSRNNAPNADQLQNVINNSNPLLLTTGNPDLKQDWQNNLNIRYSSVNTVKNTAFFALVGGSVNQNAIVNSTYIAPYDTFIAPSIVLARGSQISKPVNLDGYYNLRTFLNYSFPINALKSKLNLNLSGSQNRSPALINNSINYSHNSSSGFGASLSSNISPKVDFTLSSNSSYSVITNTLQKELNSSFFNQNTRFKMQLNPWKGFVVQTDLSHQYYNGLSANFNQNFLLWNASLGYKFLKDRQADLRLSVYDIMKQNNSVARNTTETYYEDIQTNVLQRYFMVSFTYTIRYFKDSKPAVVPE